MTYGRSGSTLLQKIVQTIPDSHFVGENHNLIEQIWNTARRAWLIKNTWGREEQPSSHPWYGADKVRPVRFVEGLIDAFIDHILQPPATVRWFGFKEIRYNAFGDDFPEVLDFMARHFKNAHFIFNSRNAHDVAKSAWWKDWQTEEVVKMVETMDMRFRAYCEAHPETTFHVSYDTLVKDHSVVRALFEKFGEPCDEETYESIFATQLTH
ncbi:sulfotransferase [Defluviimonas sp. SAOS-178_SWC]|uniref:sulfotransferase n=1 Tax=Defluviimonas sp. SAOS-178_SWC TaxID=3121287 RepID=UPI0032218823